MGQYEIVRQLWVKYEVQLRFASLLFVEIDRHLLRVSPQQMNRPAVNRNDHNTKPPQKKLSNCKEKYYSRFLS